MLTRTLCSCKISYPVMRFLPVLFAKLTHNSTYYTSERRLFLINSKIRDPSTYKALVTFATQEKLLIFFPRKALVKQLNDYGSLWRWDKVTEIHISVLIQHSIVLSVLKNRYKPRNSRLYTSTTTCIQLSNGLNAILFHWS